MSRVFLELIDKSVTENRGVKTGDTLEMVNNSGTFRMRVEGFDNAGIPIVTYTTVRYTPGQAPEDDEDAIKVGDTLPYPFDGFEKLKIK